MAVTLLGIVMDDSVKHPAKVVAFIAVDVAEMFRNDTDVQLQKAPAPIRVTVTVTLSGISIDDKLEHASKAPLPMIVT